MDSDGILKHLAQMRREQQMHTANARNAASLAAQMVNKQNQKQRTASTNPGAGLGASGARETRTWSSTGALSDLNQIIKRDKPSEEAAFIKQPDTVPSLQKVRGGEVGPAPMKTTPQAWTQFQKPLKQKNVQTGGSDSQVRARQSQSVLKSGVSHPKGRDVAAPLHRVQLISEETKKNMDLAGLEKILKMAVRPFPKFNKTRFAAIKIEEQYGQGGEGFVDPENMKVLWDRLVKGRSYKAVGKENYRYLSRLMFLGAGTDRPPLFRDFRLFNPWCQAASNSRESLYHKTIMRHYVNSEAIVETEKQHVEIFRCNFEKTPGAEPLRTMGLFAKNPWSYLARSMINNELTHVKIPSLSNGLINSDSPLGYRIWLDRLPRFTRMIIQAYERKDDFCKELAEIKEDCVLPNGKLRWPTKPAGDALAEAILSPFLQGNNRLPSEEQQMNLLHFWIPLFGDPNKPEERLEWASVNEKFRELIAHWAKGRTLNDYLEFMKQFCIRSTARVSWGDRERFWRAYWNQGRISDCKIYVPENSRYAFPLLFEKYKKYKFGILSGNVNEGRAAMTLVLDDNLMVIEINDVGKIRIGKLQRRASSGETIGNNAGVFFGMYRLNYQQHIMQFGEGIAHHSGWQRKTSDYIQMLTGKAIPSGARG